MQKDLNETIQKTIDFALKEADRSKVVNMLGANDLIKNGNDIVRKGYEKTKNKDWTMSYKDFTVNGMINSIKNKNNVLEKYIIRPKGYVKYIMSLIGSFTMFALILIITLPLGLVGIVGGLKFWIAILTSLVFLGLGVFFSKKISYISRFDRYISKLNDNGFTEVSELRRKANVDYNTLIKDLKRMIADGNLLEGHLVENDTILITDNRTYDQYLYAQSIKNKNIEEEEKIKSNKELYDTISTCEKYINEINKFKQNFQSEEINKEVDMLSENTIKIKEYIKLKPESLRYVERFVSYYLPTTTKLLVSYKDLDDNGIDTLADKEAKEKIGSAFRALNSAYKNLFEQITSINNMDINADISVLNTMLSQDGLKSDMEFEKV